MNVLIVEDEKPTALRLKDLLHVIDSNLNIIGLIRSVKEGIHWFNNNPMPDLIFQDIQLTDGNCFDIFDAVDIDAPVIFTTAFSEYAIESFKVNSIDYLVKPFDIDQLQAAVDKFKRLKNAYQPLDKELLHEIFKSQTSVFKKRFLVKRGQNYLTINSKDIAYLISEDGLTFATSFNKEKYIVNSSIGDLGNQMDPEFFYQINRKIIVNVNSVKNISTWFNSRLHLTLSPGNEEEVIVSRERVNGFKEWLDK